MEEKKTPFVIKVQPGTYYWCSCGKSKNMPYCDGSHVGSEHTPYVTTVTNASTVAICSCGKTNNSPNCDGSHKQ